ncbi:MAG TPA: GGDEF domain-containing protein [Burkholderiaceae bacterium]|nr:GGDEF domain-containing protein [Burkholderiaceae bacterium]
MCLLALATALLLGLAAQYLIATQGQQAALLALNQALAREARTDALTGCANRRHFLHTLAQERDRSARHQLDLCVLSLDIDHFKRVNDTYGHAAGDEVLKHFVATINSQLRQADLLGRLGGEEFSILLPHTSAPEARLTAERIRAAVEAAPADADGTRIAITVSIGGVQWAVERNEPLDSLLAQADHALYAAKHAGRNRVEWAEQPGPVGANPPATAG